MRTINPRRYRASERSGDGDGDGVARRVDRRAGVCAPRSRGRRDGARERVARNRAIVRERRAADVRHNVAKRLTPRLQSVDETTRNVEKTCRR